MASEAAVSFVVRKLGVLLIEEARLLYDLRDQLEWIESELRRMRCFLKDADAKQKGDERVRNWVAEIRDVSYSAEDVVDTFIFAQMKRRGLVGCVKRYICIVCELTTRHKIAMEIQRIKLKMGNISSSLVTFGIKDINDGEEDKSLNDRRRSYALFEEPDIVGLQESIRTLKEELINGEARRCVISIAGMGGAGKTTLAKKVYHEVKGNFDCHALIYLSQQYRIRDVLIRITECVMSVSRHQIENLDEEDLRKTLIDHMSKKRYLVVIDDIWTMAAWDELKLSLPDGMNKSRVLLTTRNKEVALHADRLSHPRDICLLNDNESWELFLKKIFPQGVSCPPELKETGRKILVKCHGLPLAIVVLGGLLSRREKTVGAWSKVLDSVTWHLAEGLDPCLEILALSYYELPHYLKSCFLYLGLFPEDSEIWVTDLVRLWIAEGFIQERGNEIMEDVAEDYLEELIDRSMIQVAKKRSNGSASKCRIHDLLRDLSISEATKANFFATDADDGTITSSTSMRRLALYCHIDEYETISRSTATLRSILYFSKSTINLSKLIKKSGKLQRVLHIDIADIKGNNLPKEIGEELHLSYLGLRHAKIKSLPSSIGNLSNLQALILTFPGGTLPNAVWDLKRLRHLYAYKWDIDGHPRLNNLKNLQTLCLWAGSWIEDGLDKQTNLRKLGIAGVTESHHKALSDVIKKWCNLRSLSLSSIPQIKKWCHLGSLSSSIPPIVSFAHHPNLYKMYLDGKIMKLPEFPPNLAKLTLSDSWLKRADIKMLEKLPSLRVLRLQDGSYHDEKMICSSGGFPQLEFLELDSPHLKYWIAEEGAMTSLRRVILSDDTHLRRVPKQVLECLNGA